MAYCDGEDFKQWHGKQLRIQANEEHWYAVDQMD